MTTTDTIARIQHLARALTSVYIVITDNGRILGAFAEEKTAHFQARLHTTQTSEACRVSAEPIIRTAF